ncbi:MAG TPA: dethiobiotin synthase [Acidimicrobiales bacterium]|nr:dethiobiotin synthase [Acidimicrobiales bacterium]
MVTGTGTDVGKTWLACRLAEIFQRGGHSVSARKPAQSFEPSSAFPTDAEVLSSATGEAATQICPAPRWYPIALAPPMAAEHLGERPFTVGDLVAEISWPLGAEIGLVELAGGVGSPQAANGDGVDFIDLMGPDYVLLVTGAALGALSNVNLAQRALSRTRLIVYMNRFAAQDPVHLANKAWLEQRTGLRVCVAPEEAAEVVLSRV